MPKQRYSIFYIIFLMFSMLFSTAYIQAQEVEPLTGIISEAPCPQQDMRDLFHKKGKPVKPPRKTMLLILPTISSNPANGFMVGIGGSAGWFMGPKETTRVSSITFNSVVTTKKQLITFAKSFIYTKNNKLYLQGDWRFYIYNAHTWGLGTGAPDTTQITATTYLWQGDNLEDTDGAFPLSYNYAKFHEIVNFKITDNIFAGPGYHLDHYYSIVDKFLSLKPDSLMLTPHYAYSEIYDYNLNEYTLSGISANIVYDSRDNLMNPYNGYYANINYRYNPTFLGSSQNSSSLWLEFRTYVGLSKKTPRHLIAFWTFGNFQISGDQPYLTMMAIGEDHKGRSGRAYVAGRYRGEDLIYGEVEYRFPISQCSKMLGGVLFLNLTSASNRTTEVPLFAYIRPGAGFGLRFMVNKHFRTNINLDIGFGYQSTGFYFSGTETF